MYKGLLYNWELNNKEEFKENDKLVKTNKLEETNIEDYIYNYIIDIYKINSISYNNKYNNLLNLLNYLVIKQLDINLISLIGALITPIDEYSYFLVKYSINQLTNSNIYHYYHSKYDKHTIWIILNLIKTKKYIKNIINNNFKDININNFNNIIETNYISNKVDKIISILSIRDIEYIGITHIYIIFGCIFIKKKVYDNDHYLLEITNMTYEIKLNAIISIKFSITFNKILKIVAYKINPITINIVDIVT